MTLDHVNSFKLGMLAKGENLIKKPSSSMKIHEIIIFFFLSCKQPKNFIDENFWFNEKIKTVNSIFNMNSLFI